jgi:hypothetical protein
MASGAAGGVGRSERSALTTGVLFLWDEAQGLGGLRRAMLSESHDTSTTADCWMIRTTVPRGGLRLITSRSTRSPTLK